MTPFRSIALLACSITLMAGLASGRDADVKNGKVLFEQCAACHSLGAGKNDVGPSLADIFGRKAASLEDFRYSTAMKKSNVTWDERTLDEFIEDPQAFIPGNRMPFDGLKDKQDREDLLAYLKLATKTSDSAQLQSWLILQWEASKGTPVKKVSTMHETCAGGSCTSQVAVRRLRVTPQATSCKPRGKRGIAVTTD